MYTAADLEAADPAARGLGCLACHRPHESGQRRLLLPRGTAVCKGCHTR